MRCVYCMPEEGNEWLQRKEVMSYEEMLRLCALLVNMGIEKIRITGGEPFVRKDIMRFLTTLSTLKGLQQITLTTNGVLTAPFIPQLKSIGIRSVNLSLDSLDRNRFFSITRRDDLTAVLKTMEALLAHNMEVKINCVVMEGKNIADILPLVQLTKEKNISVRFIEEMPFNGQEHQHSGLAWNDVRILKHIKEAFPQMEKVPDSPYSTSMNYHIAGHKGTVGIIAAYTRSFCGTCNRLRSTPQGILKTCLYDDGVLNVKELMREKASDDDLQLALLNAINQRARNGWEAEKNQGEKASPFHQSMATIGG
jgi:molybdenum cofactor biosynthesis protein A